MKKSTALKDSWILLPALPYFVVVAQNAPNIPIMDDYEAILSFITAWRRSGWWDRPGLLFLQYNEHRLLHSRLIYLIYYSLSGSINFRNLIILADLQLIPVALIAAYFIRQCAGKYWKIIAFAWMFCLFDLNSYEAGSIAMYGMQNYGILMLFFISLFLYSRGPRWMALAAVFQAIGVFSSGNGMIAAFFVALYTLTFKNRWKKIVGIGTATLCIAAYFINYRVVSQPNQLPFDIRTVAVYFIRMTGAPIDFENSLIFGILIMVVLTVLLVYQPSAQNVWPILCILGFVLASMGTASLFRACLKGAQFQTSRYLIYPELILAITFFFIWTKLEGKKYSWPVFAVLLIILLHTYANNFEFGKKGFTRTAAKAEFLPYWHPDRRKAKTISDDACQAGIYCLGEER